MKFARVMLWIVATLLVVLFAASVWMTVEINMAPTDLATVSYEQVKDTHIYRITDLTLTQRYTEDEKAVYAAAYATDVSQKPMIASVKIERTSPLFEQYTALPQGEELTVDGYWLQSGQLSRKLVESGYSHQANVLREAFAADGKEAKMTLYSLEFVCDPQGDPSSYARSQSLWFLIAGGLFLLLAVACAGFALYSLKKESRLGYTKNNPLLKRKH